MQDLNLPIDVLALDRQAWTLRKYSAIVTAVMAELQNESQKILLSEAFLSERIGSVSYGPVQSVLFGTPDNLPNDSDGARITNIVNIPGPVISLVTYDDHMTMEERAGVNILKTDLIGRLIPIIRHPMGDGAAWTDHNSG